MGKKHMPSDVDVSASRFDRFASVATVFVSRGRFFALCVTLVVIWAPTYFLFTSVDSWQMIVNTFTTIVTFLLVALLQNSQQRADAALQHKLNAIATALDNLMTTLSADDTSSHRELHEAVGLEDRESS